jgi:hypothetical protein
VRIGPPRILVAVPVTIPIRRLVLHPYRYLCFPQDMVCRAAESPLGESIVAIGAPRRFVMAKRLNFNVDRLTAQPCFNVRTRRYGHRSIISARCA